MSSDFNRSCLMPVLATKIDACQTSAVPELSGGIRPFYLCAVEPQCSSDYVFTIIRVIYFFNGFLLLIFCVVDT